MMVRREIMDSEMNPRRKMSLGFEEEHDTRPHTSRQAMQFEPLLREHEVPSHRQNIRPVSILKSRKSDLGGRFLRNNALQWGQRYGQEDIDESSSGSAEGQAARQPPSDKTITQTNFFDCKELTNCEFIYEQSDKSL